MIVDASGSFPHTTIELRTRANTPIDNMQVWDYSKFEWNRLGEMLGRFAMAEPVSEACPVYNCHGLTFGSRRTQVTPTIFPILEEDGFEQLKSEKDARTGDIVVYCNANGEVIHSGFVIWRNAIEIVSGIKSIIPMVWSKWGKDCEWIHTVEGCPYYEDVGNYARYFRLKRWEPPLPKPAQATIITV